MGRTLQHIDLNYGNGFEQRILTHRIPGRYESTCDRTSDLIAAFGVVMLFIWLAAGSRFW